jgi:transposase
LTTANEAKRNCERVTDRGEEAWSGTVSRWTRTGERDIRPFATSRKSWLFSDTVDGAKASATIYSLVLTCRACGVEPYDYLLHVLKELPQRPPDADVTDLLPFNYARQQQVRAQDG